MRQMNQFEIHYYDRSGNRLTRVVNKASLTKARHYAIRMALQMHDIDCVVDVQPFGDQK